MNGVLFHFILFIFSNMIYLQGKQRSYSFRLTTSGTLDNMVFLNSGAIPEYLCMYYVVIRYFTLAFIWIWPSNGFLISYSYRVRKMNDISLSESYLREKPELV